MFKNSLNELMAWTLVLEDITVADLIEAAAETFNSRNEDKRAKENETTCIKALETFLV